MGNRFSHTLTPKTVLGGEQSRSPGLLGGAVTPVSILGSSLYAWFKADTGLNLSGTWEDQGPLGNDIVKVGSGTLSLTTLAGGETAVGFDSSITAAFARSSTHGAGVPNGPHPTDASGGAIWVICRRPPSAAPRWVAQNYQTSSELLSIRAQGPGSWRAHYGTDVSNVAPQAANNVDLRVFGQVNAGATTVSIETFDGTTTRTGSTSTSANSPVDASRALAIGGRYLNNAFDQYCDDDIAEVVFTSATPTAQQIADMEAYFSERYANL